MKTISPEQCLSKIASAFEARGWRDGVDVAAGIVREILAGSRPLSTTTLTRSGGPVSRAFLVRNNIRRIQVREVLDVVLRDIQVKGAIDA